MGGIPTMNVQQTRISTADITSRRDAGSGWHAQIPDDKAMLRAARDLTKDIAAHRAAIYWPDMIGSALVGYASLAGAILVDSVPVALALGVLSVLALYRALLFIHEISHFRNGALPGFPKEHTEQKNKSKADKKKKKKGE